jgi:hypothetical protein
MFYQRVPPLKEIPSLIFNYGCTVTVNVGMGELIVQLLFCAHPGVMVRQLKQAGSSSLMINVAHMVPEKGTGIQIW